MPTPRKQVIEIAKAPDKVNESRIGGRLEERTTHGKCKSGPLRCAIALQLGLRRGCRRAVFERGLRGGPVIDNGSDREAECGTKLSEKTRRRARKLAHCLDPYFKSIGQQ